ncbi:SDR family NAD(P)-dependent oxidoreductase [Brevibacillus dissolubilis]|uniref:SDR family NAD(P)-dependent oxidoreductase n=1 Tax=Brevibacillus dissolubilis TaxID=1844116 RepID=UPI0011179E92|nr:SDR family NAD(P)-dependent oxidoreductase [Brevibacillus dissolubilis]
MSKAIFITWGDHEFNQMIASHLLTKDHRVTLQFEDQTAAEAYQQTLAPEHAERFSYIVDTEFSENSVNESLQQAKAQMDGLDVLIHGNEMINDEEFFERDPQGFGLFVEEQFRKMYLFTRFASGDMMKRKSGAIIFPVIYDALVYAGYPSSPVLTQGKISMMKSLSRELVAFKIMTNVLTLGYYDEEFDRETKKAKRSTLEIFGLKVPLYTVEQMIPAIDMFVTPVIGNISGQNFHVSAGIETQL